MENKEVAAVETEETEHSSDYMGTESITRLIIKFGIPAIATILVNAAYNMVDRIFVSNGVGYQALSAISIATPITYIMAALAMLIGVGGQTIYAMQLGDKDFKGAEKTLGNTLTAMIIMCVAKVIVGFLVLSPILVLLGAEGDTLSLGMDYMRIILIGALFSGTSYGMNNFVNASGSPTMGLINLATGCVLNIILDPIFIFVFHWGIKGAAFATILAQFVSAGMVVIFFVLNKKAPVHLYMRTMRLDIKLTLRSMKLGLASALSQATSSIVTAFINKSIVIYGAASTVVTGDIVLSAVSATTSTGMVFVIPAFGLQQAVQSLAGYNFGAKNYQRVKEIVKKGMIMALIVTIPGYIILHAFSPFFVSLYGNTDNTAFVQYAIWCMHVYNITVPVLALHAICTGYFIASGQALKATVVSLVRSVIGLVPLTFILPLFLGVDGCIWAVPAADMLGFIVAIIMLIFDMKRVNAMIANQRLPQPDVD